MGWLPEVSSKDRETGQLPKVSSKDRESGQLPEVSSLRAGRLASFLRSAT